MNLLEKIRVRWAWRRHRLPLPARPTRREPSPYGGYAVPRNGVSPALIAFIAAVSVAAGGWLGLQAGGGGAVSNPLELGAPAANVDARDAIEALSGARADGRRDLATATTPSDQAAAAVGLRRAYLRAAAEVRATEPAVGRALRRTAAAYGALGTAAEDRDRPAYARASTAVASAERDLERLIGSIL